MLSTYIQTHGTSYYLASLFFPEKIKQDVFVLYAFVRVPDDIVDDEQTHDDEKKRQLQLFCDNFWWLYEDPQDKNIEAVSEVIVPAVELFHRYEMPREWIQWFLDAMWADLETKSYITYKQLQWYMYGSAEVVGLMMCKIIWYDESQEEEVFRTARLLGEAMQYSNFLRDIHEDYIDLARIYMPEQTLRDCGLSHCLLQDYIQSKPVDDIRQKFMAAQILHTKNLYEEANKGIQLLDPKGRRAVKYASWLYEWILDKIYSNEYDVFGKDAHTSKRDKICILFRRTFLW